MFLCVGRLVPSLKLELAIRALAKLVATTRVEASLLIVGGGPCLESLKATASTLSVDVKFIGEVYDEETLALLFLNAAAVVSPGKVGLLALHALAYGTPVITHNDFDRQMPECEAITNGETGLYFSYDSAESLADALQKALALQLAEIGRDQAIRTVEARYTPDAQLVLIEQALKEALNDE